MKSDFDIVFLENATETLRAIAHPVRIAIIELLFEKKQLSVKAIHTRIGIEQAVASHHLRIMKSCGLVEVSREGKNSFYSLSHIEYYYIIESLKKTLWSFRPLIISAFFHCLFVSLQYSSHPAFNHCHIASFPHYSITASQHRSIVKLLLLQIVFHVNTLPQYMILPYFNKTS